MFCGFVCGQWVVRCALWVSFNILSSLVCTCHPSLYKKTCQWTESKTAEGAAVGAWNIGFSDLSIGVAQNASLQQLMTFQLMHNLSKLEYPFQSRNRSQNQNQNLPRQSEARSSRNIKHVFTGRHSNAWIQGREYVYNLAQSSSPIQTARSLFILSFHYSRIS